ncbi:MAG: bifunctional phosphopantothenoylcysteine decarboxylase/phosphopantothenate--cysteine ligase CoaBC [Nitriliruptoraceae bacterium]
MDAPAPSGRTLHGRRVLLGVTGGIGAYKAALLARHLVQAGADVKVVLTRGATRFVGAATFEGLTGNAVRTEVWEDIAGSTHVALGRDAEVAVVYPASAHTLAKLAGGLADDLLTTTLLAATCPLVLAPAMHTEMWQHPATQANAATLTERGAVLVGPADGPLMGGDAGPGRLVEPEEVLTTLRRVLHARPGADDVPGRADLEGVRVLVTAGGTREPIDPVRYLGNRSSGRMGFALAEAAAARGGEVVLVAAPTELATPLGVERVDVTTARELHAAVLARADASEVIVKAAAVADFRPERAAPTKLKKEAGAPSLTLVPNPDVLAELGQRRGTAVTPVLVGFAAETDAVEEHGRAKLAAKRADLLVVNDVSSHDAGFEVATNRVVVLDRDGGHEALPFGTKREVADRIWDRIVAWRRTHPG